MSRRDKPSVEVVDDRSVVVAGTGSWRPLGALGLALVAWFPSGKALLAGDLDMTVAAVRFLVAVGVAWVGLGLVATVLRGYVAGTQPAGAGATPVDPDAEVVDAQVLETRPRRRRSDREHDDEVIDVDVDLEADDPV